MNAPYKDKLIYALIGELSSDESILIAWELMGRDKPEQEYIYVMVYFNRKPSNNIPIIDIYRDNVCIATLTAHPWCMGDNSQLHDFILPCRVFSCEMSIIPINYGQHTFYAMDRQTKIRSNLITVNI